MPAADIPSNSVMTETMITDWQSRYGRSRAQTIADLDDIENARAEMPEGLPGSTWADMYASYYGNLARRSTGSLPRIKTGVIAGVIGAATSAIVALTFMLSGAATIGGTVTAPRYVASSTTGISMAASSTVVISPGGNTTSTLDMRTVPLTGGRGSCYMVTDTASTTPRSYFASWVNGAYTTSTHDCSQ